MAHHSQPTAAMDPPPGQTSNFDNPESLENWFILCVVTSISFTTILFFLRTYVRLVIKKQWILEDSKFFTKILYEMILNLFRHVLRFMGTFHKSVCFATVF